MAEGITSLLSGAVFMFAAPIPNSIPCKQAVEVLRSIGEIPADQEPILKEVLEAIWELRVADIFTPAGSQVLPFHARQVLRPLGGDPRSYEVEFFAPLSGFVLASSREHLTSAVWRPTIGPPAAEVRPADSRANQGGPQWLSISCASATRLRRGRS